jgi:hypothetical protein
MDRDSRQLLLGVLVYVATIGGTVATLGAVFSGSQPAPQVAYAVPSESDVSRVTLSASR